MASFNLNVSGGNNLSLTISVKKTGENTERFISYNSNTGQVLFTANTDALTNYTVTVNKQGCTGASTTFNLDCSSTASSGWIELPAGLFTYYADGNIIRNNLQITLTGSNFNILSATSGLPVNDKQNINETEYRDLCYSIDTGNYIDNPGNLVGWTVGLPNNLTLIPDGRVHTITVAYVKDVWGNNSRINSVKNAFQMVFKVGGSSTKPNAIGYYNGFTPSSSMLPEFITQFENFTLPNKFNGFSGSKPRTQCGSDLRNRGFKVFQLIKEDITAFPNSINYRTEYDDWAKGQGWTNTSGINNSNQATVEALAVTFMNSLSNPDKGLMIRDDEWRQGVDHTENGKLMEYYFFRKCKQISPNTVLGCHHGSPYQVNVNNWTIADIAKPLTSSTYSLNDLITEYVNPNFFGVYWADIAGRARGDNAGQYIDMFSINAYGGHYNQYLSTYITAHNLMVNKKYFPNKKVVATVAEIIEVNVNGQDPVSVSWRYGTNQAELELLQPLPACSFYSTQSAISNFVADGLNVWNEGAIKQEDDEDSFYALSTDYLPDGWVGDSESGEYAKRALKFGDYAVAEMHKYSKLPLGLQKDISTGVILPDISVDGGTTWITGDNATPAILGVNKKPMAFVSTNGSECAILASYPYNKPDVVYSYKVRFSGIIKDVSVNGQFPELFYFVS